MVIVVTDDTSNTKEVKDLLSTNGIEFHILPLKEFKKGLNGDVNLIIYDTYPLPFPLPPPLIPSPFKGEG